MVFNSPVVNVPNAALTFTYQEGTAAPPPQNVTVSSTGAQLNLTISTTPANSWLSVTTNGAPTTGTAFAVSVNPSGLPPGTYTGTVSIAASGAANGPLQISVTLVVTNNPVIVVTTNGNGCSTAINQSCPMLFAAQIGQPGPPAQEHQHHQQHGGCPELHGQCRAHVVQRRLVGAQLRVEHQRLTTTTPSCGRRECRRRVRRLCVQSESIDHCDHRLHRRGRSQQSADHSGYYVREQFGPPGGQSVRAHALPPLERAGRPRRPFRLLVQVNRPVNWMRSLSTSSGGHGYSGTRRAVPPHRTNQLVVRLPPLNLPGPYLGTITITATGPASAAVADATTASPLIIPVTFQVTAGNMTVSPTSLSFTQTAAGTAPAAQTISVSSSAQALSYNVTAAVTTTSGSVNWLTATPASGSVTMPRQRLRHVDGSKLPPGFIAARVTIAATTSATGQPGNHPGHPDGSLPAPSRPLPRRSRSPRSWAPLRRSPRQSPSPERPAPSVSPSPQQRMPTEPR